MMEPSIRTDWAGSLVPFAAVEWFFTRVEDPEFARYSPASSTNG